MDRIITMSTQVLDTIRSLPCVVSSLNGKATFTMTADPLQYHCGIEVMLNHVLIIISGDGFVYLKSTETGVELVWDSHEYNSQESFHVKLREVAAGKEYWL